MTEKEKRITPREVSRLLKYDTETGKLYWKSRVDNAGGFNVKFAGKEAFTSTERKGYKNGRINGDNMKAHRVAWAIHYGEWPEDQIDHINGDKSDNRICNLRPATNEYNCRNKGMSSRNTSGYNGVSLCKRRGVWVGKYKKDYIDINVGTFNCPTSAGIAVMRAQMKDGFNDGHGRPW